MISSAADYRLISPVGLIDGGILPARDLSDDGSAHILRTEDSCFLLEAALRIDNFRYYAMPVSGPASRTTLHSLAAGHADRRVLFSTVLDALKNATGSAGTYLQEAPFYTVPAMPLPRDYFLTVGTDAFPAFVNASLAQSNQMSAFTFSSTDADQTNPALENDKLRKLWYDYRKSRGVISYGTVVVEIQAGSTHQDTTWTKNYQTGQYEPNTVTTVDSNTLWAMSGLYIIQRVCYHDATFGTHDYVHSWAMSSLLNGESVESAAQYYPLSFASGDDALVLLLVTTDHGKVLRGNSAWQHTYYYDTVACFGTIASDGLLRNVRLGDGSSVTGDWIRSQVMAAHNIPSIDAMLAATDYFQTVTCQISAVAIIFYDSGIDTSGINWDWTP